MSPFVSRPLYKIVAVCFSVLLAFAAKAGAHDSSDIKSDFGTISEISFLLKLDEKLLSDRDSKDAGKDSFDLCSWGDSGKSSSNWDSGKSSKDGGSDRHGDDSYWCYSFGDPGSGKHDGHNDGGNSGNNGCGGDSWNNCGGDPTGGCGGTGDPSGGGSPSVPEPASTYLSFIAAGAMALLLVRRNLRLRESAARD